MAELSYPCKGCGVQIARLKFCNRDCSRRWHGANTARKKGVIPLAEYRTHIRAAALVTCTECRAGFLRISGRPQSFCSRDCRHAEAKRGAALSAEIMVYRLWAMGYGRGVQATRYQRWGQRARVPCMVCAKPVGRERTKIYPAPTCSRACASKTPTAKENKRSCRRVGKARKRAATVECVNYLRVFERDSWRCQFCRKLTPKEKRGTFHPRAPELDHIIPLSKGGEHSYRNTQLLCRACNSAKSDSDEGQQMRLFG
jgi:5-methylcytosine-specific restriction endonuclease McrA